MASPYHRPPDAPTLYCYYDDALSKASSLLGFNADDRQGAAIGLALIDIAESLRIMSGRLTLSDYDHPGTRRQT